MTAPEPPALRLGGWVVVGLFLVSGTIHLVHPETFTPIVPDFLPAHRLLVYVSGVAELACAAGLVWRPTRRLAGLASVGLLVAVFPANVTMAVHAWHDWRAGDAGGGYLAATVVRLPLQLPLIWWAWRVSGGRRPRRPARR